jgi:hypothetical protein
MLRLISLAGDPRIGKMENAEITLNDTLFATNVKG